MMSRQQQIECLMNEAFVSEFLEIVNESHKHSVPPNSETHFKLTVVSQNFEGVSKVARHQKIYAILGALMQEGLHALALHTYSGDEWQEIKRISPDSPDCMGGTKLS